MLLKALEQAEDNERELSQRIYELEEELYLKDMERESKEEEQLNKVEDYNKKEEIDNCDKDSDSAIVCFDLLDEIEENHKKIEQIRNESR